MATPTATHTYTQAGTYNVTLTITDSLGNRASKAETVVITTTATTGGPKGAFTFAQTNMSASFDATTSTDATGTITSYAWDFGDGVTVTSAVPTVTHSYTASGVMTVKLTVTDNNGLTATKSLTITVPPTSQPGGNNVTWIQQLSGSDLSSRINSVKAGTSVSFPAATFTWNDFAHSSTSNFNGWGVSVGTPIGLLGAGMDKTILKMNAGSTTKYSQMVSGGVSGLNYIYCANGVMKTISNLTIQGVSIGDLTKLASGANSNNGQNNYATASPYVYNGLILSQATNCTLTSVKVAGIPGSDYVNPGETFFFSSVKGSVITYDSCEADGRLGGVASGATGFAGNGTAGVRMVNCNSHDMRWGCGLSMYHCSGTIEIDNCKVVNCFKGMNFEQNVKGTIVNIKNPVISTTYAWGGWDFYVGANTNVTGAGSIKVTVSDPVDVNGNPITSLKVKINPTYAGGTNLQLRSDFKVTVKGVDKTSSIVTWF